MILFCTRKRLTIDGSNIQTATAENEGQYTLNNITLNSKIPTFFFEVYFEAEAH